MKINFTERTVSLACVLTFDQAALQQELLQMAAMEAVDAGDATKTTVICNLAEALGIDIDIEAEPVKLQEPNPHDSGQA